MIAEQDAGDKQVQSILREWHELGRDLYAVVFDASAMQACAGRLSFIDDTIALITSSSTEVQIPYASASDRAVVTLDDSRRSVTLTWRDGKNAFIARQPEREEPRRGQ